MKNRIVDEELLAELEGYGDSGKDGVFQRLLSGRPRGVKDVDAFRLGRRAFQVWPQFLDAKLEAYDDSISGRILALKTHEAELDRQKKDPFAWGGHIGAIVVGFLILALALRVDYSIIHEFWSRALADEFGEVPRSLASSVFFKSAQVIFATLAFHFFIEIIGPVGRKAFIVFIFTLTFIMLLGIGILIANRWMPAGSQLFGIDLTQAAESSQDMLANIGLGAPAADAVTNAVASGPITESDVKTAQTLLWLGSLSLIFLIVTGVGALCMGIGIRGVHGIFGDVTFDARHSGSAQLSFRAGEQLRVKQTIEHFRDPKLRHNILQGYLSRFVTSYHLGIDRYATAWGYLSKLMRREERARNRLDALNQSLAYVKQRVDRGYGSQASQRRRRGRGAWRRAGVGGAARAVYRQERQDLGLPSPRRRALGDGRLRLARLPPRP